MKTDRTDWSGPLNEACSEINGLINYYERDLITRKCIVEAKAGDLSWVRYGKDKTWRIFRGDRPLDEAPIAERAGYGLPALESLADAADVEMEKLMARLRSPASEERKDG